MRILIEQLRIPAAEIPGSVNDIDKELAPFIASYLSLAEDRISSWKILSRSVDARKKHNINLVFRLKVEVAEETLSAAADDKQFRLWEDSFERASYFPSELKVGNIPENPLIVGSGPAGLFAALLLALHGAKPLVVERGQPVEQRDRDIDKFFKNRILDTESNFLFGEGGAGTYSDGKLYTGIKDPRISFVLETLCSSGAPENIVYQKHPHIGSDRLPGIIRNIRRNIENLGGTFLWGRKVKGIISDSGRCSGLVMEDGEELEAPAVILAHGLSARDLTLSLINHGLEHNLKDFQIGCRIEHTQGFVNFFRYGVDPPPRFLGPAEYSLVSRPPKNRKTARVSSFCMCPGGEIIPAACDKDRLSTNGMSCSARDGRFANSALISTCSAERFASAAEVLDFLGSLEEKVFNSGGRDYAFPAQDAAAFVRGENVLSMSEGSSGMGTRPGRIDRILPSWLHKALSEALLFFERNAPGFMTSGTIVGAETKVSSPVRFTRNPESLETSVGKLYIAGEGAGYAGGIMSAAVDGLRIAEALMGLKI